MREGGRGGDCTDGCDALEEEVEASDRIPGEEDTRRRRRSRSWGAHSELKRSEEEKIEKRGTTNATRAESREEMREK